MFDPYGNDSTDYDGPAYDDVLADRRLANAPTRVDLAETSGLWSARQWREATYSPRCIAGRAANGWGPKLTLDDLAALRIDLDDLAAWGLSLADVSAPTCVDSGAQVGGVRAAETPVLAGALTRQSIRELTAPAA